MKTRTLILSLLVGLGCSGGRDDGTSGSESAVSGVPIGEVRGVVDVSNTMRTRLLDPIDASSADFDVSRVAGPVFRLRNQLGVFAMEGTATTYQGGLPTPLRITLWHQIFGRTATALGDVCAHPGTAVTFVVYASGPTGFNRPTTFRLHPAVAAKVASVCSFDGDEAARRSAAGAFFDVVMGYGSSLADEKTVFQTAFAAEGSPALADTPQQRVTNMTLALLLNPHFLLTK